MPDIQVIHFMIFYIYRESSPSTCRDGTNETVNCEVPVCRTKCPLIHNITFENDINAQMRAQFALDRPEVFFGTLIDVEVNFKNLGT